MPEHKSTTGRPPDQDYLDADRYAQTIRDYAHLIEKPGSFHRILIAGSLLRHLSAELGLSITQLIAVAILEKYGPRLDEIAKGQVKPLARK